MDNLFTTVGWMAGALSIVMIVFAISTLKKYPGRWASSQPKLPAIHS